jgi:hypothetical protein
MYWTRVSSPGRVDGSVSTQMWSNAPSRARPARFQLVELLAPACIAAVALRRRLPPCFAALTPHDSSAEATSRRTLALLRMDGAGGAPRARSGARHSRSSYIQSAKPRT